MGNQSKPFSDARYTVAACVFELEFKNQARLKSEERAGYY